MQLSVWFEQFAIVAPFFCTRKRQTDSILSCMVLYVNQNDLLIVSTINLIFRFLSVWKNRILCRAIRLQEKFTEQTTADDTFLRGENSSIVLLLFIQLLASRWNPQILCVSLFAQRIQRKKLYTKSNLIKSNFFFRQCNSSRVWDLIANKNRTRRICSHGAFEWNER